MSRDDVRTMRLISAVRLISAAAFVGGFCSGQLLAVRPLAPSYQRVAAVVAECVTVVGVMAIVVGCISLAIVILEPISRKWGMLAAWVEAYRRRLERERAKEGE